MARTARPLTILTALLITLTLAAPPGAAAEAEDPLTRTSLEAAGALTTEAGDAMPARLTVDGDDATLQLGAAEGARTLTFTVAWEKARTAPHQTALWTLTLRGETEAGELVLTGTWQSAPVPVRCTLSNPNTCLYLGVGPASLTGTLAGDALTLEGLAMDNYCTQGHAPANVHLPCGEEWPPA